MCRDINDMQPVPAGTMMNVTWAAEEGMGENENLVVEIDPSCENVIAWQAFICPNCGVDTQVLTPYSNLSMVELDTSDPDQECKLYRCENCNTPAVARIRCADADGSVRYEWLEFTNYCNTKYKGWGCC